GIAVALWLSPKTWTGTSSQTHIHVWAAILLGGIISVFPCALVLVAPGRSLNRYVIAIGQTLMSALLIHLTGGRIETHFHVFGSLVILSFYRDWRVLIPATVVVALDHYARGVYWPQSVYGVVVAEPWRWLEHAGWVVFEDIFLFLSCIRGQQEMRFIAQRTAELEKTNKVVEDKVARISLEINERKQTEMALQKAKEEAERANSAKSEFLSRMSHELRTPMNAILGFAQLLELEDLKATQREGVTHILKGGRHLLSLINEVLDIARIESGRLSLSSEPVRVSDLLQETLDLVKPLAAEMEVELIFQETDAKARYVLADRQRLKQVLLNLLSNAVKYNRPGGKVTLQCSGSIVGTGGGEASVAAPRLRLSIGDTGQGIASNQLNRLFSPFDRLGAENSQVEGTGLGLALSKRLVEAMGGKIGVSTEPGKGSLFWVELDLTEESMEPERGILETSGSNGLVKLSSRRTILYIEDNLSNLKLIEQILTHRPGIQLISAMQGGIGVSVACERGPDLILLDVNLPDMEGSEVMAHLRSDTKTRHIPVVVISADAMQTQIDRLLEAGAQAYLTKPIDVKKFLGLLDEVLKIAPGDSSGIRPKPRLAA
ncbi:MAG TPA: ATP-binding protein, partial [Candidatus Saccharimonadales bacterium]|nr:ATP-binding protein [Candidatus Saccharimonadales bacterium]